MVQTREQKVRLRYRKDLADGKTPDVRTEANMIILDEVRKEIEQEAAKGKKSIQSAASAGTARVKRAADAGAKLVEDVVKEGERRLKRTARECNRQLKRLRASSGAEEALPTAEQQGCGQRAPPVEPQPAGLTPERPAGQEADLPTASQPASLADPASGAPSDPSPETPETGVAPTAEDSGSCAADEAEEEGEMDDQEPDEEARARAEEEKREQALRERARKEEQKEQQARRAAQCLAVLKNLPAPIDKMPPWFIQNVQRYYGFDTEFRQALREKTQEALQAVEDQLSPGRAACRECRKMRRQWGYRHCEHHVARLDPAVEARINDELRERPPKQLSATRRTPRRERAPSARLGTTSRRPPGAGPRPGRTPSGMRVCCSRPAARLATTALKPTSRWGASARGTRWNWKLSPRASRQAPRPCRPRRELASWRRRASAASEAVAWVAPESVRRLTVKEAARLQTFPRDYDFQDADRERRAAHFCVCAGPGRRQQYATGLRARLARGAEVRGGRRCQPAVARERARCRYA